MVLRHLLSVVLLPVTVALIVPVVIARRQGIVPAAGNSPGAVGVQVVGVAVLLVGLVLFFASLRRFAAEGDGTLAPWDPPRRLVVRGPYRYVRNPMISGVVVVLFGEALMLRSGPHTGWAALFLAVNLLYIPALEEPMLEARFGDAWREYCRRVPRFLPRLRPWTEPPPE